MDSGHERMKGGPRDRAGNEDAAEPDAALTRGLAAHIARSLLPGSSPLDPGQAEEVAGFLLETAVVREPGEPVIALESATRGRRFARIAIVNDDMPFLVDSIASTISAHGLAIDRLLHPVATVRRDGSGGLQAFPPVAGQGDLRESLIYVETARTDSRTRRALRQALAVTLGDVRAAVTDWPRLKAAMTEDAERVSDPEGAALLRWLNADMLTLLGHVTRGRDGGRTEQLGICRASAEAILADASFDRAFALFDADLAEGRDRAPLVAKANRLSNVHRRVPLDLFIVPVIEQGRVEALSVHAGIWTSAALNTPPDRVPRMREQLARLIEGSGFDPASHTGKSLFHALAALPHDLVIGFADADVARVAATMTSLVDQPRPRLVLVQAALRRHLFAFVWLPRDLHSTVVRLQIQALLEQGTGGAVLDWSLQIEEGNLALLRFVLDIRDSGVAPDEAALDARLQALLRGWAEAVESELASGEDATRAAALAARFANAFPAAYRADHGPAEAALDILRLRRLSGEDSRGGAGRAVRRDARFYSRESDEPGRLRLKLYQCRGSLPLSDAVPALENFGFRVLGEVPTPLDGGRIGTIHDFTLALPSGAEAGPLLERAGAIEAALAAVINGLAEDDAFNRLTIAAALSALEAGWLRAFYRYLRQAGRNYTIATVVDVLARAPAITRALVELFRASHDPARAGDRAEAADRARREIDRGLADVAAINDDRLLRHYLGLIDAIVRTNAFVAAAQEALAFKLDSARVPGLPKPVPWREIFVYSRRVEGVHLRAGPVARGGIRWSDRRDDVRTEILGLMKAQRVKNAVIVPTGAKGGFYPKQLPDPARDRDGWAAEGRASYEIFIRSLLSLTDNIVGGKIAHPKGVVIHDDDDPYFVVAADKGTASFSDLANAIAEAQEFWLDDAFASGGSHGYDHKAMGITARGAWISVQRHFLELGIDVQKEPIRVVGCGDMSGDVFGNGMLQSKAIRLVAAFDHRHIFIDPDPDPAASWRERRRMFGLPRSSWDDYDR
jgi:glutamate dehydrogenase